MWSLLAEVPVTTRYVFQESRLGQARPASSWKELGRHYFFLQPPPLHAPTPGKLVAERTEVCFQSHLHQQRLGKG